jgi:hypothetical protein
VSGAFRAVPQDNHRGEPQEASPAETSAGVGSGVVAGRRSPSCKAWGKCRRCEGTGRKVRLGRLLYEALGGGDGDR